MVNMNRDIFSNSPFGVISMDEDEGVIIEEIRLRVADLLDENPELLFSYLYRLDVEEKKIRIALKNPDMTADEALAHLIWSRQKQRLETRNNYKDGPMNI